MTLAGNGGGDSDRHSATRIDMRLAMPLCFDRQRGELALVLQNLGSSNPDFQANFLFERRAFVTLRLDN
jgi:iron complex outermembrane receptor protein